MAGAASKISARAEGFALRALEADPNLADARLAMVWVAFVTGDVRAGLRRLRERLEGAPTHALAHSILEGWLWEAGRTGAGFRRFDVAHRLGIDAHVAFGIELRVRALHDQSAELERILAGSRGTPRMASLAPILAEVFMWQPSSALAAEAIPPLRAVPPGSHWDMALPLVESVARGERSPEQLAVVRGFFQGVTRSPLASWHLALNGKNGAAMLRYFGGGDDEVLAMVEHAAAQTACIDLAWFDRTPSLESLRSNARFTASRAERRRAGGDARLVNLQAHARPHDEALTAARPARSSAAETGM
ncbi:MAG: hypothetical protein FJ095_00925 [Deltaproteobacteria bacterium]|nr:hypothetical protein [Deltaproteobacteria bacterium]